MPTYNYVVKDQNGKTITGKISQDNPSLSAKKLKEMNYVIIKISEETPSFFAADIAEKLTRIKLLDKVTFYIKLASMLKAGVPMDASISSVGEQLDNKRFRKIIGEIYRNIQSGNSLSQSLSLYPKVFPELLISVVRSGEASGKLVEVLGQYAKFATNQANLRQKILSALFYPSILLVAAIGLIVLFLTYLLPKFVELFQKSNLALPLPTQILVKIANIITGYPYLIIGVIAGLIISIKIFLSFEKGKVIVDNIKLHLPPLGKLIKKISIERFTRTLGTLYNSGVPIIKSLQICEKAAGNSMFSNAVIKVKEAVIKGKSISSVMSEDPLFPSDVVQLVSIGEKSGNLSDMLSQAADFYENDIDSMVKKMSSLIEPVILLAVGSVIGFLAYSIIMPIFNLMHAM
jgi:type IV pilus assembly protein PilC